MNLFSTIYEKRVEKIVVFREDELAFCGSIHDPDSLQGLSPYLPMPVTDTGTCGTYLTVKLGEEVM